MPAPPKESNYKDVGFPALSWEEESLATRPMPLHERPLQARIDSEMETITRHHARIARAIAQFWGHRDCLEYLQKLILNGDVDGHKRVGFKPEVLSALINLVELHKKL